MPCAVSCTPAVLASQSWQPFLNPPALTVPASSLQIKELVGICKEYVIALRCELKRKELKEDDMARAAELAAYFTHCNLQVRNCIY